MKRSMLTTAILGILGLSSSFTVLAENDTAALCAGQFNKRLPTATDPLATVPMWGYALGGASGGVCTGTLSSPGPRITVGDNYTGVDITLTNTLPRATSLVIPGTVKGMQPVFFAGPQGLQRVHSFDAEAATGGGTVTYNWNNLKPGSYMYHSGTHPQVQVQMGLFGALTDDHVAGQAYDDVSTAYSQEIILFYYEIDRIIHEDVVAGDYSKMDMRSTIDYHPKHFFIDASTNGIGAPPGNPGSLDYNDVLAVAFDSVTDPLVRFYNAGLRTHIPTVFEADFSIIAEDGKLYPKVIEQYTVVLPPLKTTDAFLNVAGIYTTPFGPANLGIFRLTDSAMAISNPAPATNGPVIVLAEDGEIANGDGNGMVMHFVVEPPPGYVAPTPSAHHPKATKDSMGVVEGGSIANIMTAAISNDIVPAGATVTGSILTYPSNGELNDDGSGDFTYQHDGGEHSQDSIVYAITNAEGEQDTAGIIINVSPSNDAPVANDDTVSAIVGTALEIRVLNNDTDVDSATLSVASVGTSSLGTLTGIDQAIIFEPTTVGTEVVAYTIKDSSNATATANLLLSVAESTGSGPYGGPDGGTGDDTTPPTGTPPVANDDSYTVTEGSVLDVRGNAILGVMANDSQGATTSTGLLEYPEHGSLDMLEDGTFIYTHDGSDDDSDNFSYEIYNAYGTATAEVTITVTPEMDAPHVNNDRARTKVGTAVLVDVLKNDKDGDSDLDPNGIVISSHPSHGSVEIVIGGGILYTPSAGYSGSDTFRYQLKDSITGELSDRSAKVKIRIR